MARIICGDKEVEVKDGDNIYNACRECGVPFGCMAGACGVCKVDVLEGEENLDEITPEERRWGFDGKQRLACRCKIKHGEVKITL
ncbi:2Fe-2S iron-sulfur cluster binding domain-containing protein [Candidatus Woesearchaeota archaeon]|jgi:ferredoxin|nr:2Fe-2S iron-sulfur cluster binding domain-containing protein [Candidatus Woesearchaeota archaeon]MBT3538152.1 2Fe-2S iron-sulfur cluster binding domain-containing protein [Candidatus Woesearchaeota archaeon]MBT4697489.1 2Fe-2S iron-sulfur cluster binding domain-containing protein [Candidatus Woesearchaeota archaeon]MBT4716867.1 2Fe-2S iron-sulfur cluster binding domain-containing protein [Candidatus Woesearchaeota archaeon]MBT7105821.1 2Fe-2S iron-sulfur cluster binding domain-containing pro